MADAHEVWGRDVIVGKAIMSPCGQYRYRLERDFCRPGPTVGVFMVNPAWADANEDDNTITKLSGFGRRLGWGKMIIGNVFAKRTEDVNQIGNVSEGTASDNLAHVRQIFQDSEIHIAAWGTLTKLPHHLRESWKLITEAAKNEGHSFLCFGTTKDGHPRHPGQGLGYDTPLQPWREPPN
jgi:hypothetical protein